MWPYANIFWFFLERFRSIAKSYFRRADGVLLLYDVTCEKSFINVREWVDMIEVRALHIYILEAMFHCIASLIIYKIILDVKCAVII